MVVLIMERVPVTLRGELSRWMIEQRTGVFVGKLSAMVRDAIWNKACRGLKGGGATMLYTSQTEQGFSVRSSGEPQRVLMDMEGLLLVHIPVTRHGPSGIMEETEDRRQETGGRRDVGAGEAGADRAPGLAGDRGDGSASLEGRGAGRPPVGSASGEPGGDALDVDPADHPREHL